MSHVVVARKFGATIPEMGIILYWFMPGAFVNLSSIACIPRRINRIKVFMAGIFFNLALSGISLIICKVAGVNFYLLWIAIDNIFNAFMNLLIFLKLDGYLVFKELVNEAYLYEGAISYTKSKFVSFVGKKIKKEEVKFHNIKTKNDKEILDDAFKKIFGFISMSFIPILIVTMVFSIILVIAERLI
jgi:Zn-dependent protease